MENRDMLMESNNKYTLLITGSIKFKGRRLYRIQALTDFSDVKKGDIGGYVEGEHNLEPYGDCWIYDDAKAMDEACVTDYAVIRDNAIVMENAVVADFATVKDNAVVTDNAWVSENITIQGDYVAGACEVLEGGGTYGIKDNVTDFRKEYNEVSELDAYKNLFKAGKISLDELAFKCYSVGKQRNNDLTVYKYSNK